MIISKKKILSMHFYNMIHLSMLLLSRGAENVRTRERGLGEILINNLKTENKWKFS